MSRIIKKLTKENILKIGNNTRIIPPTNFDIRFWGAENRIVIGEGCRLQCNYIFESEKGYVKIGDRTSIGVDSNLISRSGIEIGDDVIIAWGVWIYDHNSHSLDWKDRIVDSMETSIESSSKLILTNKSWKGVKTSPIRICNKVWIGFNAIILKGVTIGEGAVVGAGAVVTQDVLPYTVVAGNPAREVRKLQK